MITVLQSPSAGCGGKQPPGDDAAAHLGLRRWMQHHADLSTGSSHVHHIQRAPGDRSVVCKEQQGTRVITVFARDSGSPPLESVATASVRVLDQNDNAAVFVMLRFIFSVPEDVPLFAEVGGHQCVEPR